MFACIDLDKRVGDITCCRYSIIQQIAKQRGKVVVCNKIRCPAAYVSMKSYVAVSALLHIAA